MGWSAYGSGGEGDRNSHLVSSSMRPSAKRLEQEDGCRYDVPSERVRQCESLGLNHAAAGNAYLK